MATGDVWSFQTASTDREKPIVQDLELQILENVNAGALVGQAAAYVIDGGVLENWRIVDFDDPNGNGTALLRIDPEEGPLYVVDARSEEHTSELKSLMRSSFAVFCS